MRLNNTVDEVENQEAPWKPQGRDRGQAGEVRVEGSRSWPNGGGSGPPGGPEGAGVTSLDYDYETSKHPDGEDETSSYERYGNSHYAAYIYCACCGLKHEVTGRCRDRTCPDCRYRDFRRIFKGYRKAVRVMKSPKLLTLTLLNQPELVSGDVKRLRKAFIKLMKRKWYSSRVRGGLCSIEIKNEGRGWNIHMHILIDCDYLPQDRVSRDWLDLTGDSYIVDIRKAWSPAAGLSYILKYLTKSPSVNGEADVYNSELKGLRLVQPFGSLYNQLKLEKSVMQCEDCGGISWMMGWQIDRVFEDMSMGRGP